MLTINYPIPTYVKEVCVYSLCFLSSSSDSPALFSPTSLICHQWISGHPLMFSPLILMYKISGKTAILWSIFSIYWDFASWQLSSVWFKYAIIRLFLRLYVLLFTKAISGSDNMACFLFPSATTRAPFFFIADDCLPLLPTESWFW